MAGDLGPSIVAANLVVAILATLAVAMRLLSRQIQKAEFKADDIFILVALVCFTTTAATSWTDDRIS